MDGGSVLCLSVQAQRTCLLATVIPKQNFFFFKLKRKKTEFISRSETVGPQYTLELELTRLELIRSFFNKEKEGLWPGHERSNLTGI